MSDYPSLLEEIISQASDLSPLDKIRLIERLVATLERDLSAQVPSDWVAFVEQAAGSLADDPIQRWPQGDYEDRDAIP